MGGSDDGDFEGMIVVVAESIFAEILRNSLRSSWHQGILLPVALEETLAVGRINESSYTSGTCYR